MELDNRLKNAFDAVHAEASLKESSGAFVMAEMSRRRRNRFGLKLRPIAAFACMMLVFISGYISRMYFKPVSVISIDINPSIELGVNIFDHVVSVASFNEDGSELTEHLQLRFLNYQEAVDRIVNSETVTTLLDCEEELYIAVVGEDENRNAVLCDNLEQYTASNGTGTCYSISLHAVKNAHSCGMSYGKYMAYQIALQKDESLTPEDIRHMTMKEIREIAEPSCHTDTPGEQTKQHHAQEQQQKKSEQHHSQGQQKAQSEKHHGGNGKKHQTGHG